MRSARYILQLLLTVGVIALINNSYIQLFTLLFLWMITFYPIRKVELLVFLTTSLIYAMGDIGAVRSGFFQFLKPDYFGLPLWEFLAWGFWFLHTHRVLDPKYPKKVGLPAILIGIVFFLTFSVIQNRELIYYISLGLSITLFAIYHSPQDIKFYFYMLAISILVETVGVYTQIWSYPNGLNFKVFTQFCILWSTSGILFYRIIGPFLNIKPLEKVIEKSL